MNQLALDWSRPLPPVQDQRVPRERQRALKGHNLLVLERLRRGPATNVDLALLLPEGSAWRSRASDVRKWLELRGETVRCEGTGGLRTYRIEAKR